MYDEPDTARIVFKLWIVEALFWWEVVAVHVDDPKAAKREGTF
jgi:hypothetical protein